MIHSKSGDGGHVQRSDSFARKSRRQSGEVPPSPRQSGVTPRTTISDIKARLTAGDIHTLCRTWLPNGKRQGGWWIASTPWRDDKNPSLGVSLTTGIWKDFANPDTRGDIFDLCQKIHNASLPETIEAFKDMLGMNRD